MAEIEIAKKTEKALTDEIAGKRMIYSQLEQELADIKSGKKLAEFVHDRNNNSRYKSKLGVISWVREDFENLDSLLRGQKEVSKKESGAEDQVPAAIKVDRIILYIDDLDRCPEDRVVEVLEAVHLLLSFELFGVVVGVDPRWVSHSLNHKYKGLIKENFQPEEPNKLVKDPKHAYSASTYDYLEKIFQIPFALLPIEDEGAKKLLKSYIKPTDENPKTTPEPETPEANTPPVPPVPNPDQPPVDPLPVLPIAIIDEPTPIPEVNSKQLYVTNEEIAFILEFSSVIGNTPRTIQRFVNVYRIIRAHPQVILPETFSIQHQCIIGFLAIVVGEPYMGGALAKDIIKTENQNETFLTLIKSVKDSGTLQTLFSNPVFHELSNTKIKTLKEWAPLVSRFSFRATEMMNS